MDFNKVADWIKDTVKGKAVEKKAGIKTSTVENIAGIKSNIAEVLKAQKEVMSQYDKLIGSLSKDENLIQTEIIARDAAKQIRSFSSDLSFIEAKVIEQEKELNNPVVVEKKKGAREMVDRESVSQKDTFNVVDPTAMGDKKRSVTISLQAERSSVDNETEEEYVVVSYWAESWEPIFEEHYSTKEDAQQMFDNFKIKLGEINKLVTDNSLEEAEEKTKEFLGILEPVTEDLVEDSSPITTTQASKKPEIKKEALLLDQITMSQKGEILAYSGSGSAGEYIWQKDNRIEFGEYTGVKDSITDAKFSPIKVLEFPNKEDAVTKAKEFVNSESLRDRINRFTLESLGKTVPPPIPEVKKEKPQSLPKEVEVGKPPVEDAPETIKPVVEAPAPSTKPVVDQEVKLSPMTETVPGEGVAKSNLEVPVIKVASAGDEVRVFDIGEGKEMDRYTVIIPPYAIAMANNVGPNGMNMIIDMPDIESEEAVGKEVSVNSLPEQVQKAIQRRVKEIDEEQNEIERNDDEENREGSIKNVSYHYGEVSGDEVRVFDIGEGKEMDRYTVIIPPYAIAMANNVGPNGMNMIIDMPDIESEEAVGKEVSVNSLPEQVQKAIQRRVKEIDEEQNEIERNDDEENREGSIKNVSYHYGEVSGNDYVLFNEAEEEVDRISLNSVVKQALNSFPVSIPYDSINVKAGNVEVLKGKKVIENFNIASLVNVWMNEVGGVVRYVNASLKSAIYLNDVVGMSSEVLKGLSPEEYSKLNSLIEQQDSLLDKIPEGTKAIDAWKSTGVTTPDVRDFISSEKNLQNVLSTSASLEVEKKAEDEHKDVKLTIDWDLFSEERHDYISPEFAGVPTEIYISQEAYDNFLLQEEEGNDSAIADALSDEYGFAVNNVNVEVLKTKETKRKKGSQKKASLSKEAAQDPIQELKGIVSAINSLLSKVQL